MIAIDAMGGDYAPHAIIEGAYLAARTGIKVCLFGDETLIESHLHSLCADWRSLPISFIHCSQVITMDDEPVKSVRKKDSSLIQAMEWVAIGKARAVVSAGNSGACLVAGMVVIGKLPNVLRPAIGGFLPTQRDSVFCTDLGANADCRPEFLQQFALMGSAYVQLTKNIAQPRIGLLSNGAEAGKGSKLVQQTYELLTKSSLHFIGNCEPQDVLHGAADVVVCDGFSGNIMLKSMEATVQVVTQWLKDEGNKSFLGRCVGLFGAPIFRRLKKNIKKTQRGGALLLGLKKPLIIAHGSSNAQAIEDAIHFAHSVGSSNFYEEYNKRVVALLEEHGLLLKGSEQELKSASI
ncbi:MAG: phosphate acyltransferase PlsX [Candidatus Babeliales bacterium]